MPEMQFLMLLTNFIEVIRRIRAVDRSVRNVKSSIGYGYAGMWNHVLLSTVLKLSERN